MRYSRYIIAAFFISLFIFNGVCSIVPKLFAGSKTAVEKFYSTETESEKKETNERPVSELKELYLNNSYPSDLFIIYLSLTEKNSTRAEMMHREDIHISIPTPPPEQV